MQKEHEEEFRRKIQICVNKGGIVSCGGKQKQAKWEQVIPESSEKKEYDHQMRIKNLTITSGKLKLGLAMKKEYEDQRGEGILRGSEKRGFEASIAHGNHKD